MVQYKKGKLMKRIISIILLSQLGLLAATNADFEKCDESISSSCMNLAKYYEKKHNIKKELSFLEKASELGIKKANFKIGLIYLTQKNVKTQEYGLQVLESIKNSGNVDVFLGYVYSKEKNKRAAKEEFGALKNAQKLRKKDLDKAMYYFEKAEQLGCLTNYERFILGKIYLKKENVKKTEYYLLKASSVKDYGIRMQIAKILLRGKGQLPKQKGIATNMLNIMAESGYKPAVKALEDNNLTFDRKEDYDREHKKYKEVDFSEHWN